MKISHDEYLAVQGVLGDLRLRLDDHVIRQCLEAAFAVRKARKQAKRERQRKEKDKQVVESVKPTSLAEFCEGGDESFAAKYYRSKAHEWDGNASAFDAAMKPKA